MIGRFGALLAVALLAGCAAAVIAPRAREPFDVVGRVLAAYSTGAVTANVRWEHGAARDEIWLMTPTGQTLAHILDTAEGVILTRADREEHRARSVEALTRQVLGWPLPLSRLQHWVRGAPAPGEPAADVKRDASNRIVSFTQENWSVAITYGDDDGEAARVRRVDLVDGPNRIRFVIDTWRAA